jgi:hypothetical protein
VAVLKKDSSLEKENKKQQAENTCIREPIANDNPFMT